MAAFVTVTDGPPHSVLDGPLRAIILLVINLNLNVLLLCLSEFAFHCKLLLYQLRATRFQTRKSNNTDSTSIY